MTVETGSNPGPGAPIYDQSKIRNTAAALGADAALEAGGHIGAEGGKIDAIGSSAGDSLWHGCINERI
ncbi:MAG TPA: hypothetical protein VGY56_07485 [Verrucomicrobiae bacterium]|nr:hypothetical protein [Verrucomicrobiae bacterium]